MKSMTGFGSGTATVDDIMVRCEIRSVNHRGLDVKVRMPRELSSFEPVVTTAVRERLERGRVDAAIVLEGSLSAKPTFVAAAAGELIDALLAFARARGDVDAHISAGDLLRAPGLVVVQERSLEGERFEPALREAVKRALLELEKSRAEEGRGLRRIVEGHREACARLITSLRDRVEDAPTRVADKLRDRVAALDVTLEPQRLAQEVALLAERADVSEELARLETHLELLATLTVEPASVGRKLDFLCQELLREANTTGSKCQDAQAAHRVIELKAEIEKLREQVQNIE